ncbi:hypothetical protein QJS83_02860 [Bdellovibrio sp. 22V]|nr:hypothetical protein [Bdellovibrio sp. 22V]WII72808.1 hypothetical protein QJS83_02860 [Bdellovibrio sp. 22V]
METFKPATPPAWKRFFGNPLIQLSLLVVVAGGVGVSLYQKGQQNLERRVSYLKSTVQINSTSGGPSETFAASEESLPTADQASQTPEAPSDAADGVMNAYKVAAPTAAGSPTPAAASDDKTKERSVAKLHAPHLVVYYAEVGRGRLNAIVDASRSTGQFMNFNDYSAGILPNISKNLQGPQIKILHKEERALDRAKSLQWFYGWKDRRDLSIEIGHTTFFELNEMDANNLRGNLEIQRTWREMGPNGQFEIQRKSFPAIFEIGGETGFFMSGVMPPQSNLENDDELTSVDIYKILRSPQFRAGESEFVIFIEFEKGN